MKKIPWPFIIILIIITVALAVLFYLQKEESRMKVMPDVAAVAASYDLSARDIVGEYRKTMTQGAALVAEDRLLNLVVPPERRDVHLDLVLALHAYAQTKPTDVQALKKAKNRISKIIEIDWLK